MVLLHGGFAPKHFKIRLFCRHGIALVADFGLLAFLATTLLSHITYRFKIKFLVLDFGVADMVKSPGISTS